ncbi:MAG: ATP-binding protein [Phycisphaerae bacterium]|jgi:hypothetical protein|nr:ATP-binding protein [Phycisphaerae bacterium]
MASGSPHFRVSSALKTIIGKDLITDDIIAVFELVKNAFDAHAKRVNIEFKGLQTDSPTLIISDDGKGMDRRDIRDKWLFVAYSAKKDGSEDYRDKIQSRRIKAGAKGIGRFSCDKLGAKLTLYSRKQGEPRYQKVVVDWEDFENDAKQEFQTIPVVLSSVESTPYRRKHGTILEISGLREIWDRDKLLKLKRSLEKLINPNQGNGRHAFGIHLKAEEEKENDLAIPKEKPWDVVNGEIQNFLFEDLDIRTTSIHVAISSDGKTITTRLVDRGTLIYELVEKNTYELLKDIGVYLFVLNRSAKMFFTRSMGLRAVEFGSIFLFKNGFRIYPFGDVGDDTLQIDRRKQQGQARYLGSRDLVGRIEINGGDPGFRETSSRDGGLIKNEAFESLRKFITVGCLRRLEKFAVDVIKWGKDIDLSDYDPSSALEVKEKIFDIVKSLTNSADVIDLKYDPNFLDICENISEASVKGLLRNFRRIADERGSVSLGKEARRAERHLKQLQQAREEAEAETEQVRAQAEEAEERAREAEEEARQASEKAEKSAKKAQAAEQDASTQHTQNLFLQSILSSDLEQVVHLHHHIGIAAGTIMNHIKDVSLRIQKGKSITTDYFQAILEKISFEAHGLPRFFGPVVMREPLPCHSFRCLAA